MPEERSIGIAPGYFRDRAVVITGASSGIGADAALAFGERGARVALLARRKELLDDLAGKIEKAGSHAYPIACDVAKRDEVFAAIAQAHHALGKIDVLVNSAGVLIPGTFEEARTEDLERMMAVNYFGLVHATQAALPIMRKANAGSIVNVASLAGRRGISPLGGYAATKFAVVGISEALRVELVGTGIRVSLVMPGVIDTPMAREAKVPGGAEAVATAFAMPVRWVTWAIFAAVVFGLAEVDVPPGSVVGEKLAALFPGITDTLLNLGYRFMQSFGGRSGT